MDYKRIMKKDTYSDKLKNNRTAILVTASDSFLSQYCQILSDIILVAKYGRI